MSISLPDGLKSFLDEQLSQRGYGTSSEYLLRLRFRQITGFHQLLFYIERSDHIDVWRVLHGRGDIAVWMQDPDVRPTHTYKAS